MSKTKQVAISSPLVIYLVINVCFLIHVFISTLKFQAKFLTCYLESMPAKQLLLQCSVQPISRIYANMYSTIRSLYKMFSNVCNSRSFSLRAFLIISMSIPCPTECPRTYPVPDKPVTCGLSSPSTSQSLHKFSCTDQSNYEWAHA